MQWDPTTLVVVLGQSRSAKGALYADDGETFEYESGAQIFTSFFFRQGILDSDVPIYGCGGRHDWALAKTSLSVRAELLVG